MTVIERRDVVVIGGGPAGLAAALGARRAGADDVLLLERDHRLGGILNQCIHDGFGLVLYEDSLTGPEYAERLIEDVDREGVRARTGAMVLDLSPDLLLRVNSRGGYRLIQAGAVVLAMGCRERTREMIAIPGTRPAGIFTAGAAQNLVNLRNARIGNDVVILGSGDIGLIMARRLTFEGLRVRGVLEIMPWAGGLERNIRQCLLDFGIPLRLGTAIVDIRGRDRVESVTTARVDEALRPLPGTEGEIPCDTLLLSVGLIPENELARAAGVTLSPLTGGAAVDETLMTSVAGIFSCGNVLHIHDVADFASDEGFAAGAAAARFVRGERASGGRPLAIAPGRGIRYALPQSIRAGAANLEIKFRVDRPRRGARVEVRGISSGQVLLRKECSRLLPTEMQRLRLRRAVEEPLEVALHEDRRRRGADLPGAGRAHDAGTREFAGVPGTPAAGLPVGDRADPGREDAPGIDRLACILCAAGCELEVRRLDSSSLQGSGGPAADEPEAPIDDAAARAASSSGPAARAASSPASGTESLKPGSAGTVPPPPGAVGAKSRSGRDDDIDDDGGVPIPEPEADACARLAYREGLEIRGQRCDRGAGFAVEEVLHPLRNLAASVPLAGTPDRLVSVRLTGRIPRERIFPVLAEISKLRPAAPIRRGQVLLENVLGTGVDVVATRSEP